MPSKVTIHTLPINRGPFNCRPAMAHEIESDHIAGCPVFFPWEGRHGAESLFVICNEFGAMGAVWADNESDALDALIDANLGGGIEIDEPEDLSDDEMDYVSRAGNDSRAVDLTHCSILVASFDPVRDLALICAFHEARGAGRDVSAFV